jgi:hypothetical protein
MFLLLLQILFIGACEYAAKIAQQFQITKYFRNFFSEMGDFFSTNWGDFLKIVDRGLVGVIFFEFFFAG